MSRKRFWFVIIAIAAFIGVVFFLFGGFIVRQFSDDGNRLKDISEIPQEALQNGHVICRYGDGIWSDWIIELNQRDRRYSHIGVLSVKEGKATVIHADTTDRFAISGKVLEEPLETFTEQARRIGIFRLKGVDPAQLVQCARHYLGRPFDWKMDATEKDSLYCSELIKAAIDDTGNKNGWNCPTVTVGNTRLIPVDAFLNPEDADELYEWPSPGPVRQP